MLRESDEDFAGPFIQVLSLAASGDTVCICVNNLTIVCYNMLLH